MPRSDYTPTSAEVALVLRSRAKDVNGNYLTDWTVATVPTKAQVEGLIEQAAADAELDIGTTIPEAAWEAAKLAVIYRTGMMIEMSFFPEQIGEDVSIYDKLEELYNRQVTRVDTAINNIGDGDTLDSGDVDDPAPLYGFPENEGGMVGWGSRW